MELEQLARKNIQQLTPYSSARSLGSQGAIWLNANESPFSPSFSEPFARLNRYPMCQPEALISAYANYAGVEPSNVLVSRGADEGIDLLIRTFCEPGQDSIIFCPPTYGMYAVSAEIAGVDRRPVTLDSGWQLDLPAIANHLETVKLVFICNPNNPTGSLIQKEDIQAVLDMTRGKALVVVDEAYVDFCPDESAVTLMQNNPHLVILRTLSKAFALAGLRCGFTLANPTVIQLLLKVIAPYPIAVPVEHIALEALSDSGRRRMADQREQLNTNRDFLANELTALEGVNVFASATNYLLVQWPDSDSVFSQLWNQGITVRKTVIANCLRISIGALDELKALVRVLKNQQALSGGKK